MRVWDWVSSFPSSQDVAQSVKGIVAQELGRIALVRRGQSDPRTPYHQGHLEAIRHIKNALATAPGHRVVDSWTDETCARHERGRSAVRRDDFSAFGQVVFGHLSPTPTQGRPS